MNGGSYPVGGSSEVAYTMIPVIEKSGGKVLVRASVHEIVQENGRAVGVTVGRNKDLIKAPLIISNAGIINTLKLLNQPEVHSLPAWGLTNVEAGTAAMCAFIALKGTNEENNLPKKNFWVRAGEGAEPGQERQWLHTCGRRWRLLLNTQHMPCRSSATPTWTAALRAT